MGSTCTLHTVLWKWTHILFVAHTTHRGQEWGPPEVALLVQRIPFVLEKHRLAVRHILAVSEQLVIHELSFVGAQLVFSMRPAHVHVCLLVIQGCERHSKVQGAR